MSKKKVMMIVIAVLVVVGIAGTALGGGKEDKKPSEKTSEKKEYGLNQAVMLGDQQVTVKAVEKSAGSEFDKPKEGMEYVIITLEIVNKGDEDTSYNPLYFKVKNSQGQKEGMAMTIINTDTAMKSGDLAAGGTVSGTIVFEEPIDDAKLTLIYQPITSSDKIEINLQ